MNREEYITLLRRYREQSADKYGILAMGIFGSTARNERTPDSDLDIFVRMATPNPFYLAHIKEEVENITRCKVDIVRLHNGMNTLLKNRIEKDGLYV
ncbi:MAG: nucleotidyltransferase domain-containing protein [Prevotellaceae bacterium]|jgi:predicted nucleotidyltransferase|nr:nucleotidyltransferase domain-containing protein [Prevotellaceae bacterium]